MDRLILNGSMRSNMEKIAAFRAQFISIYPSLPNFCPKCDFSHPQKLWFRRGHHMLCHKCGYKLEPTDYWVSEFEYSDK